MRRFLIALATAGLLATGCSGSGDGTIAPPTAAQDSPKASSAQKPKAIASAPTTSDSGAQPSIQDVTAWVKAYKAAHSGRSGKDWDINAKTADQLKQDPDARRLRGLCGGNQRPVIPAIAWEYGGNDHQWINPNASAFVYCVYAPVASNSDHWKYQGKRVTADVWVLFPDDNPCKDKPGAQQVLGCLGASSNSEILVDTASINDGQDVGLNLSEASTDLRYIQPDGQIVSLLVNH